MKAVGAGVVVLRENDLWSLGIAVVGMSITMLWGRHFWRHQVCAMWASVAVSAATLIAAIIAAEIAYWAYGAALASVTEAKNQTAEAKRHADAAETQIAVAKDTEERQLRAYVVISSKELENFGRDQIGMSKVSWKIWAKLLSMRQFGFRASTSPFQMLHLNIPIARSL